VGGVRARRGDNALAAAAYKRAAQEDPSEERWMRAADAAEKAKQLPQAIESLQRVQSFRGGNDAEVSARIARLKSQMQAGLLPKL